MAAGYQLAREGAGLLPALYPDRATWANTAERLHERAQELFRSTDEQLQAVGFFLFGMAQRAGDERSHGNGRG